MSNKNKFVKNAEGEKIKLDKYGRISYHDRVKVIPGGSGIKKLREDISKLKAIKIKY